MKKILIIDDDPMFTSLLKQILEENNFYVTICHSCCEGVNKLTVESFDLITLDIAMPILDGFETFEIIRRICNTPVLIITSMLTEESIQKIKTFSLPFLLKPIFKEYILEKIKEILK